MLATIIISHSEQSIAVGLRENLEGFGREKKVADVLPPGNHQHSPSNSLSRWPQPRTQQRKRLRSRQRTEEDPSS